MKKHLIILMPLLAALALSGCSSFKMGAACYIPYGVTGQCSATTVQEVPAAAPAGVKL